MVPIWGGTTPGQHSIPRCGSSAASVFPSIHNTVDRSKPIHEYIGFPPAPRGNLEHNTLRDPSASSHKRTSSSSSAIESTKGVKRSRREPDNNIENLVDIIKSQSRKGKMAIPSAHSADAMRTSRGSKIGIGTSSQRVISTHWELSVRNRTAFLKECGQTLSWSIGGRITAWTNQGNVPVELGLANVPGRGAWSYCCTLSDSVELQQIRLLINTFIQNLALIESMRVIWNGNWSFRVSWLERRKETRRWRIR